MPKPTIVLIALLMIDQERMDWRTVLEPDTDDEILTWAVGKCSDFELDHDTIGQISLALRWSTDSAIDRCNALRRGDGFPDHVEEEDLRETDPEDREVLERESALNAVLPGRLQAALERQQAAPADQ